MLRTGAAHCITHLLTCDLLDDPLLRLLCNLVGANRQSPVRPDEMAGIAVGILLEIILMLGVGLPEVACPDDLRNDPARPQTLSIDRGDGFFGVLLLLVTGVADRTSVAGPDVVALAITRAWVVNLEEKLQKPPVTERLRIKDNLNRFGMISVVSIGRVRHVAARISNPC